MADCGAGKPRAALRGHPAQCAWAVCLNMWPSAAGAAGLCAGCLGAGCTDALAFHSAPICPLHACRWGSCSLTPLRAQSPLPLTGCRWAAVACFVHCGCFERALRERGADFPHQTKEERGVHCILEPPASPNQGKQRLTPAGECGGGARAVLRQEGAAGQAHDLHERQRGERGQAGAILPGAWLGGGPGLPVRAPQC